MKKAVIALAFSTFPMVGLAQELPQFNYVEFNKVGLKGRESGDTHYKGFGIGGSKSFGDYFFVNAEYHEYDYEYYDGTDNVERRSIGGGAFYPVNQQVTPFFQFDYIEREQSYFDDSMYLKRGMIGMSGNIEAISYKAGYSKYEISEDIVGKDTTLFIDVNFWVTKQFAVGVQVERFESSNFYEIGAKLGF